MRTYKYFVSILAIFFIALTTLSASPLIVSVTFTGAGPVSDGTDYVLPYQLTVAGVSMEADCYDYLDQIKNGQTWEASELTLSEAAASGQFSGVTNALSDYEDVAWLSSQTTSTPQNQIDLQHLIWDIFDPGAFSMTNGMTSYLDALDAAQSGFTVAGFNSYMFLEAIPVLGTGLPQPFVFDTGGTIVNGQNPTPEPGAWLLMLTGFGLIAISKTMAEARRKSLSPIHR